MWFDVTTMSFRGNTRGHQRPRPGLADLLLHQPAERPLDVLPRPRRRHHPAQRVCRRGSAVRAQDPVEQKPRQAAATIGANPTPAKVIPATEIPLVIQDKTFVPSRKQLPTKIPPGRRQWGGTGNLWLPHVYMPNQNPSDARASTPWAAGTTTPGSTRRGPRRRPVANPLAGTPLEGPQNPGTRTQGRTTRRSCPSRSWTRRSSTARRTRSSRSAASLPLPHPQRQQRPQAQPAALLRQVEAPMWNANGTLNDANAGEVKMVPPASGQRPAGQWPTDGRDGGVPDPRRPARR